MTNNFGLRLIITGIVLYFVVGVLVGCAPTSGGGGSSGAAVVANPNLIAPTPTPTIPLTYYKITITRPAYLNTNLYTVVGSCVVYLTKTYCWDDGLKITAAFVDSHGTHYPASTNSYWNQETGLNSCTDHCASDALTAPTFVSSNVSAALTSAAINTIFSSGAASGVICTDNGSLLSCGDFSIDLNQTAL